MKAEELFSNHLDNCEKCQKYPNVVCSDGYRLFREWKRESRLFGCKGVPDILIDAVDKTIRGQE